MGVVCISHKCGGWIDIIGVHKSEFVSLPRVAEELILS
jgi:hypothetical protein